jgi:WD40 repeat protein
VSVLAFGADGRHVLTASWDGSVRLWTAAKGEPVASVFSPDGAISMASLSGNGQTLITVSREATRVWDVASGDSIGEPIRYSGPIQHLHVSDRGFATLTGGWPPGVVTRRWSMATGDPQAEVIEHREIPELYAVSADGRSLAAGRTAQGLQIYDAHSGRALGPPVRLSRPLNGFALSPDGTTMVTAAVGQATLWRFPAPVSEHPEWLLPRVELSVGTRLDPNGMAYALTSTEWSQRRRRLDPPEPDPGIP